MERLEPRVVLTVTATFADDFNILEITADADGDVVLVSHDGDLVLVNDTPIPAIEDGVTLAALSNVSILRIFGDEFDDEANDIRILSDFSSVFVLINGGGGDDILVGGDGAENLFGGDGDDQIFGGGGDDLISGDAGEDILVGEDGNDAIGGGDDKDELFGADGVDDLSGGGGDDELQGGDGDDNLFGNDGNDRLFGQAGDDALSGHAGDDGYIFEGGALGADELFEAPGEGVDFLDFGLFVGPVNIDLGTTAAQSVNAGNLSLTLNSNIDFEIVVGSSLDDTIIGNAADNFLFGEGGDDEIFGEAGKDTLLGQTGDDELFGEAGEDTIIGGQDDDQLQGGSASDKYVFDGNAGGNDVITDQPTEAPCTDHDVLDFSDSPTGVIVALFVTSQQAVNGSVALTLTSSTMIEDVIGSAFNDTLLGNTCQNKLEGRGGDDTLSGREADDILVGGDDDDIVLGGDGGDDLEGNDGNDILRGDQGIDELDGGGGDDQYVFEDDWGDDEVNEAPAAGDDTFDFSAVTVDLEARVVANGLVVSGPLLFPIVANDANSIEHVITGSGDDVFSFADGNVLAGGAGTIDGGGGENTLDYSDYQTDVSVNLLLGSAAGTGGIANIRNAYGGAGQDVLDGDGQENLLDGNGGMDVINGGGGNDELVGGAGNDLLAGGDDNDKLFGGLGDDQYFFSEGGGQDEVFEEPGEGVDQLRFLGVNSDLTITLGSIHVTGGGITVVHNDNNVERIEAGAGDDQFVFGNGVALAGGAGVIDGGGGTDTLDYSVYTTSVDINLATKVATGLAAFVNVETLIGGSAPDGLQGDDLDNSWNILDNNEGEIVNVDASYSFFSFETITGGANDDVFLFSSNAAVFGAVHGGNGSDTLDFSLDTFGNTFDLADSEVVAVFPFSSVETFIGGSSSFDELVAGPGNHVWNVTGAGAGNLDGQFTFLSVESLIGGPNNDTFVFSPVATLEEVDGGSDGLDTLDYSSFTTPVFASLDSTSGSQSATAAEFVHNISDVIGGSGDDELYGGQGDHRLVGNDGDDLLVSLGIGSIELDGGADNDSYEIEVAAGEGITFVVDSEGFDSLEFISFSGPIVFDVDLENTQSLTADENNKIAVFGDFESVTGTLYSDTIYIDVESFAREVFGKSPEAGANPGDRLVVNTRGGDADVLETSIFVEGFSFIDFESIEQVLIESELPYVDLDSGGNLEIDENQGLDDSITVEDGSVLLTAAGPLIVNPAIGEQLAANVVDVPTENIPGGQVIFNLGGGDDTLSLDYSNGPLELPVVFNGGAGADTLKLLGGGHHLDLTDAQQSTSTDIEVVDVAGDGANQLTLTAQAVMDATDAGDLLRVEHNEDDTVNYGGAWTAALPQFVDGRAVHVLGQGDAVLHVANTRLWRNPLNDRDINRDGQIAPDDVLAVINTLILAGVRPLQHPTSAADLPPFYYDSTGDNFVAPDDALRAINALLNTVGGGGEGESVAQERTKAPAPGFAPVLALNDSHRQTLNGRSTAAGDDALLFQNRKCGLATSSAAVCTLPHGQRAAVGAAWKLSANDAQGLDELLDAIAPDIAAALEATFGGDGSL